MTQETSDGRDRDVVHWQFETKQDDPTVDVAEAVAQLEGKDSSDLSTIYGTINHLIDNIFSDPPAPEAQVEVSFTYEGYRITMNQDGSAKFVKVD